MNNEARSNYYWRHHEQELRKANDYYRDNRAKALETAKARYARWKTQEPERYREYLEYVKEYQRQQIVERSQWYFRTRLRARMRCALRRKGIPKAGAKIHELLGCSVLDCRKHIERQFKGRMTWLNWGKVWEIDHIRPLAAFDLRQVEQQKIAFHYLNLRPLLSRENRAKGASRLYLL